MTTTLDCHPASPEELNLAHENVHTLWSKGLPLKEHVKARLNAPHHRRANWYVGTVDGEIAVSLGSYPMQFQLKKDIIPGIAIGSVYTKESHRKKGFASILLTWVENYERDQYNRKISSLYCDINPAYYEKHGYFLCPSFESETDLIPERHSSTSPLTLEEFDKDNQKSKMKELYTNFHSQKPFSVKRSDDYWDMILEKFPQDQYFWLKQTVNKTAGYFRLQLADQSLRITDYALVSGDITFLSQAYSSLIHQALKWDCQKLTGWLPDCEITRDLFKITPRKTEITMIKPLDENLVLDFESTEAANFFCEIDHV